MYLLGEVTQLFDVRAEIGHLGVWHPDAVDALSQRAAGGEARNFSVILASTTCMSSDLSIAK